MTREEVDIGFKKAHKSLKEMTMGEIGEKAAWEVYILGLYAFNEVTKDQVGEWIENPSINLNIDIIDSMLDRK